MNDCHLSRSIHHFFLVQPSIKNHPIKGYTSVSTLQARMYQGIWRQAGPRTGLVGLGYLGSNMALGNPWRWRWWSGKLLSSKHTKKKLWKDPPFSMGKSIINCHFSIAMLNIVKLPEGIYKWLVVWKIFFPNQIGICWDDHPIWRTHIFSEGWLRTTIYRYPLVMTNIAIEDHHF